MDYLEDSVKDLRHQNIKFRKEIDDLRKQNEELAKINLELTSNLPKTTCTCRSMANTVHVRQDSVTGGHLPRPAESCDPQQKGQRSPQAELLAESPATIFLKVLILCNLTRSSSTGQMKTINAFQKCYSEIWSKMQKSPSKMSLYHQM